MKMIAHVRRGSRARVGMLLSVALLAGACGNADLAGAEQPPASGPAPAISHEAATPTEQVPAPEVSPASRLVGTWRQHCQPYLPGDGASDITYSIDQTASDRLTMEGVAKDYKNTSCSGQGTIIARPKFEQRIVGTTMIDGVEVVKLIDADAVDPAPADAKSVFGLDNGQLRIGNASGARDADGFPSAFEPPASAYENITP